jgi:thymidylate kinase
VLITLSGLDGAGKSTLIRSLRAALEEHHDVVVCHMNHDIGIFAAVRAVRDAVVGRGRQRVTGSPEPSAGCAVGRRSAWERLRHTVVWNKPARRLIYLADLLIFLLFRLYVEKVARRILIMDRYFYDTLVDVAGPNSWTWLRLLAWLTPRPDLAVLLNTSPEEAYARKGEYSIDYLANRSMAYGRVFGWAPTAVALNAVDLACTTRQLVQLVADRAGVPCGRVPPMATEPSTRLAAKGGST